MSLITGTQNVSGVVSINQRGGQQGDGIISALHSPHYESAVRGKRFHVATQALVTTTVGLATTYTGLVLSNPITSTVNLVVEFCSMMQSVLQGTQVEAFALATGFNATTNVTHTTPVAVRSNIVGATANGQGVADVSATLPTAPFYDYFITNTGTATADSTGLMIVDMKGTIVVPPGGYVLWVTPAQASVAGMWFGFEWEEVPVLS